MTLSSACTAISIGCAALCFSHASAQLIPNCARSLAGYRTPELRTPSSSVVWDRDGAGPEQPLLVISINGDLGGPFGTQALVGWDGDRWVRLFPANPTTSQLSNLFVHDGNLYGLSVNTLVQVTPSGFTVVSPAFGTIKEAISFNGEIVVCGTSASNIKGVFALRSGAWVQIGATFNNDVTSISSRNGQLVAAGSFTLPGITNIRAAVFNGTNWVALGSSTNHPFTLNTIRIRAVGSKVLASNDNVLMVLDQDAWTRAPENGQILLATDTHAYVNWASSEPGIIKFYDGSSWSRLDATSSQIAPVQSIAEYQNTVYAFGTPAGFTSESSASALRLSGLVWSRFGEGPLGPVRAMARSLNGNLITASGLRSNSADPGSFSYPFSRAWDGFRFRPAGESFPGPPLINNPPGTAFHELTSDPEFDVLASGYFFGGGNLPAYTVARYISNAAWGPFGTPLYNFAPGSPAVHPRVFKVLRYRGELLALGEFSLTQLYDAASIARYQNGTWVPVAPSLAIPTGGGSRFRNAIVFDDKLFVVGLLKAPRDGTGTFMYYNGVSWSQPTNALRDASAFAVHNNQLYAVANDRLTVVRWNGTSWDTVTPPLPSTVHALASYRGLLFAGGDFGLRYHNGLVWVTPSNVNFFSSVFSLLEHNNELAIGGNFTATFSSNSATNFARFTADYVPPIAFQPVSRTGACGETTKLSVTINPNYGVTTYRWRKNGDLISDGPTGNGSTYAGAGTRELSIVNLKPDDAGSYECTLSVVCGSRTATPAIVAVTCCPADLNNDLAIDDDDFQLFAAAYDALTCASPAMPVGCQADLNADGVVDDTDFVLFAMAYDQLMCP
jgi:hypothetical protein